jgi:pyruvate dehydrogenase E2 component (dihydrolipoamide acetyltransferase)
MRAGSLFPLALGAFVAFGASILSPEAHAQEKPKPAAARSGKARGAKPKKPAPQKAAASEAPAAPEPEPSAPSERSAGEGESGVKGAGSGASAALSEAPRAKEQTDAEGVKTYQFGAIEVEGRLRSPQVIYFLRRVRAEFDAGALGHRSFLRELSDTRNDPAFR